MSDTMPIPEVPDSWRGFSLVMTSAEVWEDHRAAREGAGAGVTIDVLDAGRGAQRLTMLRTERYSKEDFVTLLRDIYRDALRVEDATFTN